MSLWENLQNSSNAKRQSRRAIDNSNSGLYQYLMADSSNGTKANQSSINTDGLANGVKGLSDLTKTIGKHIGGGTEANPTTIPSQYKFENANSPLFGDYNLGGINAGQGSLGTTSGFAKSLDGATGGSSLFGKIAPYAGIISGALSAGTEATKGGNWSDDVPQAFFGIDKDKDSDFMQALKGAGQGATMGMPFGPIGAVVGGALGLGSSFLDDI